MEKNICFVTDNCCDEVDKVDSVFCSFVRELHEGAIMEAHEGPFSLPSNQPRHWDIWETFEH